MGLILFGIGYFYIRIPLPTPWQVICAELSLVIVVLRDDDGPLPVKSANVVRRRARRMY